VLHNHRRAKASVVFVALIILPSFASTANAAPGKCDIPFFDPVCEAGKSVAGAGKDAVTAPIRYAAGSAVEMVTSWVADAAQWVVGNVINFIDHSTSPRLDAGWFSQRYEFMIGVAALVLVPMLLIATIRAVVTQDAGQLARSFFVYLPTAILGTFLAIHVTQALLAITDEFSAAVAQGVAGDTSDILDSAGRTLSHSVGLRNPGVPLFAVFFGALLLVIGSVFVWLELLVRSAAVTVSVFFLPLILAGLVWPATARWTKRLIEILVALIVSKFVIVAVISLATAALSDPGQGGFGTVMGGAALMLMAAFSPFALLKLAPLVEGAAVEHLQGMGRRPISTVRPGGSVNQAVSVMRSKVQAQNSPALATWGSASSAGAAVAAARAAHGAAKEPGRRAHRQAQLSDNRDKPSRGSESDGAKPRVGGQIAPSAQPSKKPQRDRP
jgi:type IV secretion system protein TrbL